MKPSGNRGNNNYEKVKIGEMLTGVISDIKYDPAHKFTWQGKETICEGVRIVLKLEGYEKPHGTKWMKFSYGEKSNIYKKFLTKLVEGAKPDMDFDLDNLKGLKVKTLWAEPHPDFQEIESIFPVENKVSAGATPAEPTPEEAADAEGGEEIPF